MFLFLDIDGVLNSRAFFGGYKSEEEVPASEEEQKVIFRLASSSQFALSSLRQLDPVAIQRLNRLIQESGAKIVISSTWRRLWNLADLGTMLRAKGFLGEIVGQTPVERDFGCVSERGAEIQAWLDTQVAAPFVILDDDNDMGHLSERLVLTDAKVGLTDKDVDRALELLRE